MTQEKVMYIQLPDGAEYRRVEVTEDGRIGIVYTRRYDLIPKPKSLIGGTEVYQKDNGTPYWYCKIKEGRDEFMYLYFDDLTENDLLFDANGKARKFTTIKQEKFMFNVLKALKNKPQEGYRWIPVFEPSTDLKGNLQYVAKKKVAGTLATSYNWEDILKKYSPINGSHLASITTYFLLLLRWLKDGVATLEQLSDDSKDIGNYLDSKDSTKNEEKTGKREFGGLFGFAGNTYKYVKDGTGFSLVGGYFQIEGNRSPLAAVYSNAASCHAIGLLELTK